MSKNYILSADKAKMKMQRMAYEILERNNGIKKIHLAGIMDNGLLMAELLKAILLEVSNVEVDVIPLKMDKSSSTPPDLDKILWKDISHVIVIDDVVNSGKTLMYALLPFLSKGISRIQTLTLVERSYKTYPVHVDYVGVSLATTLEDHIQVEFLEGVIAGAYLH
jgi:pyrimidine operon attenuation protein/uracil phosphoribosyltransferase